MSPPCFKLQCKQTWRLAAFFSLTILTLSRFACTFMLFFNRGLFSRILLDVVECFGSSLAISTDIRIWRLKKKMYCVNVRDFVVMPNEFHNGNVIIVESLLLFPAPVKELNTTTTKTKQIRKMRYLRGITSQKDKIRYTISNADEELSHTQFTNSTDPTRCKIYNLHAFALVNPKHQTLFLKCVKYFCELIVTAVM